MNGVGWLQKHAVCGKIDSYGASQGHFRCKSGRECHAGGRFHVLVSQRMPSGFARRALYYPPTISHFARAFISTAGDFTHRACFYITRRRIRAPCGQTLSRARLVTTASDFTHRAFFSIERRWFCVLYAYSFTSLADGFACHAGRRFHALVSQRMSMVLRSVRVLFYIARRRFHSSCVLLHERKEKI